MKKVIWVLISCCILCLTGCSNEKINTDSEVVDSTKETVETSEYVDHNMDFAISSEEQKDDIVENDVPVDGILFTTEYTVEDYCQGCFIVSKNDGLLYGVLDKDGNEMIPVQYDEIKFTNKEQVVNGKCEELYIQTVYEKKSNIVDKWGNVLISGGDYLYYIEYKTDDVRDDCARFYLSKGNKECFYDGKLDFLFEIPRTVEQTLHYVWLNSEYFLIYRVQAIYEMGDVKIVESVELYDVANNELTMLSECGGLTDYIIVNSSGIEFILLVDYQGLTLETYIYDHYKSDENGVPKLVDTLTYDEFYPMLEQYRADNSKPYAIENIKFEDKRLYKSNDTWKLEHIADDTPVYNLRYYECIEKEGCFFLMNEDNQLCLINHEGNLMVDYGWLTYDDREIYFNEGTLDLYDNFFPGDDGVCFTQGDDVYFFYNKEW